MSIVAKRKWWFLGLTLALALSVPSQSHALNWLSQWWLGNVTQSIPDLGFTEVSTAHARLAEIVISRFRLSGSERINFDDIDLTATVESQLLTFDEIILTEGTTIVTISIDPADLHSDVFGSSFRTHASVIVETEDGTTEFEALVRGRITERNGIYNLSAALFGNSVSRISTGNYLIDIISLALTGTAEEELSP